MSSMFCEKGGGVQESCKTIDYGSIPHSSLPKNNLTLFTVLSKVARVTGKMSTDLHCITNGPSYQTNTISLKVTSVYGQFLAKYAHFVVGRFELQF